MNNYSIESEPEWPLADCLDLTFVTYHPWLLAPEPGIIAIVIRNNSKPIGLCLADSRPVPAILHSVAVSRSYRKRGVAKAMVHAMEKRLAAQGCPMLRVEFTAGSFSNAMNRLLLACGWISPTPYMCIYRTTSAKMAQIDWVRRLKRPRNIELGFWGEVSYAELEFIRCQEGKPEGHPIWLSPFFEEDRIIAETSLVARHEGKLVGWGINHESVPGVHRFSRYWVEERFQRNGMGVVLMAEAARLVDHNRYSQVVCGVLEENSPMVAFCNKRIRKFAIVTMAFQSTKSLI